MIANQSVSVTLSYTEWVYLLGYLEAYRAAEDSMTFSDIRNGIAKQVRDA